MVCDLFTVFFLTKTMEISKFQDHHGPRGVIFTFLEHFMGPMKMDM